MLWLCVDGDLHTKSSELLFCCTQVQDFWSNHLKMCVVTWAWSWLSCVSFTCRTQSYQDYLSYHLFERRFKKKSHFSFIKQHRKIRFCLIIFYRIGPICLNYVSTVVLKSMLNLKKNIARSTLTWVKWLYILY